ncbi:hypothetical protein O181_054144 [Austropuccinia psidii MF-1]|uniref:Uncharacterized protein n=1 Tax=Austropuccinia psidii MF-1 TaxID=1389203 RepID=A0A9Q3E416_9BASI|nr:hypothetical protein [Austropuccinia psidii MF-1]
MDPGHVGEIWVHGVHFGPGGLPSPPRTADCGVHPADHRTPKTKERPKRAIQPRTTHFQQDPKKAKKAIESIIIRNYLSKCQGPKDYGKARGRYFQGKWGQDPLKTVSRTFSVGKEGSSIRLALGN